MIKLIQQNNRLIGSLDDIQALSCKKGARVLVVSDTHGNYKTFKRIITEFGKTCDGLILCGDCYADITALILEARADSNLQALIPSVIAFVQGNGDPSRYPMGFTIKADCKDEEKEFDFSKSLYFPQKQILCVNNHDILITHGHNEHIYSGLEQLYFKAQENFCKVVCYGHSHYPSNDYNKECTLINPGSCSLPRGGQPASFAILTAEDKFVDVAFIKIMENGFSLFNPVRFA